jgi:hypothetical protein
MKRTLRVPFLRLRAPHQTLRTHRSLDASCATLWWRWLVFSVFPCNGAPGEWNWQGKTEVLTEKIVPVPLCPSQISHQLTWDRTRASAVRCRRLTGWATAHFCGLLSHIFIKGNKRITHLYSCVDNLFIFFLTVSPALKLRLACRLILCTRLFRALTECAKFCCWNVMTCQRKKCSILYSEIRFATSHSAECRLEETLMYMD